jgi:tetratricopeptide (TPR) repeat protein
MDNYQQLELLRSARGDSALLALTTVDLTFPDLSSDERAALRSDLEAAAVPHWCDATILAGLADDARGPVTGQQWARLSALGVVEAFPARGVDAGNVHEASRLALRKRLAETDPARFLELSVRSARVFESDQRSIGRIEWVYHLLTADPDRGAAELADLSDIWLANARHEDLAALSEALTELDTSQMLQGLPLARARLVVAQHRAFVSGAASLGDLADRLLLEAKATDDAGIIGHAHTLVGDVAQDRGDLATAEQAYVEFLAVFERLSELDPINASWQEDLAVAHSRLGGVARARGDLAAAEQAFLRYLTISEQLAGLDPANSRWQRDLAIAHSYLGDVAQARGDLAAAQRAYAQALAILERLAELDPASTGRRRDLAVICSSLGGLARARGDLTAAQQAYTRYLAILERLAGLDPTNGRWQRDLAVAHGNFGGIAEARGDLATAQQAYTQKLTILERLADLDSTETE